MSKQYPDIEGRWEVINNPAKRYETSVINVVSFWGGSKLGRMVQITIHGSDEGYTQLTKKKAKKLIKQIKKAIK